MGAREIMAEAILSAGKAMGALAHRHARTFEEKIVAFQVEALTAAGYRIIGPGDLDRETLERAAEVAGTHIAEPGLSDNPAYIRFNPADLMAKKIVAAIRALTDGGHDA